MTTNDTLLSHLTPTTAAPILAMREAAQDLVIMRTARLVLSQHPDPVVQACLSALISALTIADKHYAAIAEVAPTEFDTVEVQLPARGQRQVSIGRGLAPHENGLGNFTHITLAEQYAGGWAAKSASKGNIWALSVDGHPAERVPVGLSEGQGVPVKPGDVIEIGHTRFVLVAPGPEVSP